MYRCTAAVRRKGPHREVLRSALVGQSFEKSPRGSLFCVAIFLLPSQPETLKPGTAGKARPRGRG